MTNLPQRFIGIAICSAVLFTMDLAQASVMHALILPLLLALAAYLITQSLMAVALASFTLALANADLAADFWVIRWAYPALAVLGIGTCLSLLVKRFRKRIETTREERWAPRNRHE